MQKFSFRVPLATEGWCWQRNKETKRAMLAFIILKTVLLTHSKMLSSFHLPGSPSLPSSQSWALPLLPFAQSLEQSSGTAQSWSFALILCSPHHRALNKYQTLLLNEHLHLQASGQSQPFSRSTHTHNNPGLASWCLHFASALSKKLQEGNQATYSIIWPCQISSGNKPQLLTSKHFEKPQTKINIPVVWLSKWLLWIHCEAVKEK